MNERKDEQWLDEQLRRAINTTRPQFDAEAWRRDHAEAYQTLLSRRAGMSETPERGRRRLRLLVVGLAAAAVIFIAVTLPLIQTPPREEPGPVAGPPTRPASPARLVSMMALRTAYRQGGEEGLNQQLDTALKKLGPRPSKLAAPEVLSDLEG